MQTIHKHYGILQKLARNARNTPKSRTIWEAEKMRTKHITGKYPRPARGKMGGEWGKLGKEWGEMGKTKIRGMQTQVPR